MKKTSVEKLIVKQGNKIITTREEWPLRRTPQNIYAAVYNKKVYPLYSDSSINLDDRPFSKDECPNIIHIDETVRYADETHTKPQQPCLIPEEDWYIEKNQFGNYLVLDGSEHALDQVLDALELSNIPIRRFGRTIRAADNGRKYDWYIGLKLDIPKHACQQRVKQALNKYPGTPGVPEKPAVEGHEDHPLAQSVILLADALKSSSERIKDLETDNDHIKQESLKIVHENKRLLRHSDALGLKLKALNERVESYQKELSQKDAHHEEMESLRRDLNYLYEEIGKEEIKKYDEDHSQEISNLKEEIGKRDEKISELESSLEEAKKYEKTKKTLKNRRNNIENFLNRLMGETFPKFIVHETSFDTIDERFTQPDGLIRSLSALHEYALKGKSASINGRSPFKKCACPKGNVYEYATNNNSGHVSTGQRGARGRIYFRQDGPDKKWVIFVDWKEEKEQSRTIEWISDLPLDQNPIG